MLTLVIDSASASGLLGLVEDDRLVAEERWTVETNYSRELLARIESLLGGAGRAVGAIGRIVVNTGPGGYGSLRAGVATAQGLALGLDVPLAGVVRFEADVAPHLDATGTGGASGGPVIAVHDAGSSGIAWAAYARDGAALRELVAPRLDTVASCLDTAPAGGLWCGEVSERLLVAARERGDTLEELPAARNVRQVLDFVRIAERRGAFGDAALVDVLYLRPPSITRPA